MKIFRKIRQNLLVENKFRKYLLYAVGEIILVVIGILIALYINNQNQARLSEEKADAIMTAVLVDFEYMIDNLNFYLEFYLEKEILFDLILNDKLSYDDYHDMRYPQLTSASTWCCISTKPRTAYDNLTNEISSIPEKYKNIFQEMTVFYENRNMENQSKFIEKLSLANAKNRADNYDWYSQPRSDSSQKIMYNYFLNDPLYKNEVYYFAQRVKDQILCVLRAKKRAQKIYEGLATTLNVHVDDYLIGYNEDVFKTLVGEWETESKPGSVLTFWVKNDELYYVANSSSIGIQCYLFSNPKFVGNTQFIDNNRVFYTLEVMDEKPTIRQIGGVDWVKVK